MTYPFVLSVPHCAESIPEEIKPRLALSPAQIMDAVDHGTAEIFSGLPAATVISAQFSRLVCDLNRNPDNTGPKGIVAKTDYHGREIFKPGMYPDEQTIRQWVQTCFRPYHEALAKAIRQEGIIGLFDCHSLNGTGPSDAPDAGRQRRDVIISNNGDPSGDTGSDLGEITCPPSVVKIVQSAFEHAGFSTAVNNPYKGGFITVNYGLQLVQRGKFGLQIEMNQDLYLDDQTGLCDPVKIEQTAERVQSVFEVLSRKLTDR